MSISEETGSLRVVALDGDAGPVVGAAVMIVDSPQGHDDIIGLADARGRVEFGPLAPGLYVVAAISDGGHRIEGVAFVGPDELTVVRLQFDAGDHNSANNQNPDTFKQEHTMNFHQSLAPVADDLILEACTQPAVTIPDLSDVTDPERASAIVTHRSKWVSGTTLQYYFFTDLHPAWGLSDRHSWLGGDEQEEAVRQAFKRWKDQGIGLDFVEVDDPRDAEIRIGFVQGDGSWSYLGRQILEQGPPTKRTMNFGWDLTTNHGRDTALHEIGHTLGMPHEHQNPNAGIVWDEPAVLARFAGPPNRWNPETTRHNILAKLDQRDVFGSEWDPDSVMHYTFGPGLILEPETHRAGIKPELGLSRRDIAWVQAWYPPVEHDDLVRLDVNVSHPVQVVPGAQAHFEIVPDATRDYTLTTLGRADTVLVLFEEDGSSFRYLAGDDDSGQDRNASIDIHLVAGRQYILRSRLYHSSTSAEIAIVLF